MSAKHGPLIARVASIASRQHGVIGRRQLLEIGMRSTTIADWVSSGHLHRIHRGVYAVGQHHPGGWLDGGDPRASGLGPELRGCRAAHPHHRSPRAIALHVSVPSRSGANPSGIVVHRPRRLDPGDITHRFNIPTTSPTRTLWDLSTILPSLQTRRAFERAEKVHSLSRPRLSALLKASPSGRGAATIRQLLSERPLPLDQTRSWLEDLLLVICRDHSLPIPAVNVPVLDYEVDFLWPAARFVVEADGGDHLDPDQRDRDNERDIALGRAGYLVRRYSSRAMGRERAVAAEVLEILRERLPPRAGA